MIVKIIDRINTSDNILLLECERFMHPQYLDKENNFICRYWLKGLSEPKEFSLTPPFKMYIMEDGKTVDKIDYLQGYDNK